MKNLADLTTRQNADAYDNSNEKFTFSLDLLEISASHTDADKLVNQLEDEFEFILKHNISNNPNQG